MVLKWNDVTGNALDYRIRTRTCTFSPKGTYLAIHLALVEQDNFDFGHEVDMKDFLLAVEVATCSVRSCTEFDSDFDHDFCNIAAHSKWAWNESSFFWHGMLVNVQHDIVVDLEGHCESSKRVERGGSLSTMTRHSIGRAAYWDSPCSLRRFMSVPGSLTSPVHNLQQSSCRSRTAALCSTLQHAHGPCCAARAFTQAKSGMFWHRRSCTQCPCSPSLLSWPWMTASCLGRPCLLLILQRILDCMWYTTSGLRAASCASGASTLSQGLSLTQHCTFVG